MLQRLRDWLEVVRVSPVADEGAIEGGRKAERFLEDLVQAHQGFQGASFHPNKRVPGGRGRREIDLIVVTAKRIHVIEVKNWSGSLREEGGRWVQTNRNHREIAHPDLAADHQHRNAALVEYLRNEGVALDRDARDKYFSNKIIFMNPRLSIESRSIRENPDVLAADRLQAYLDAQRKAGVGERTLGALVQWCFDSESAGAVMDGLFDSLARDKVEAVRAAFDRLSTWDAVEYYGSKVETGDLLRLTIGGETIARDRLPARSLTPVRWSRRGVWGFLKAITGIGKLGRIRIKGLGSLALSPRDTLLFHRAGEPSPVEIPLHLVEGVRLG